MAYIDAMEYSLPEKLVQVCIFIKGRGSGEIFRY